MIILCFAIIYSSFLHSEIAVILARNPAARTGSCCWKDCPSYPLHVYGAEGSLPRSPNSFSEQPAPHGHGLQQPDHILKQQRRRVASIQSPLLFFALIYPR